MSAIGLEHVAFACARQLLFDIANTVGGIANNQLGWDRRGHSACDQSRRKLWFGHKTDAWGHIGGCQMVCIVGPYLRKICSEDADLTVRKRALSTKLHALVDTLGNPLDFILTPGQAMIWKTPARCCWMLEDRLHAHL